ncbi:MAG TPA: YCF48-related protein [Gammaproteobacteria bacterium]|nr:YCF48-related protein [Gammaproteobacteria bacterium]
MYRAISTLLLLGWLLAAAADDTTDARLAPLAAQSLLLDATRAGPRLVAVGEFGHVLLSDDAGANWRQAARVPTRTTLTAVTFADARLGWAVGHGGQILHTQDGGETWTVQYGKLDGTDSLFSVWFENATHGIAVGPYGYALATQDGGKTWEQFYVADGEDGERHLNQVFAGIDGRLYIAAEIGGVFLSDDGGASWRLVQTPYDGSLWGGTVRKDGSVIVVGMVGHALLSTDRGETWTALTTGTDQSLTDVDELDDGRVVLVGLGGAVAIADPALRFAATVRPDRQFATSVLHAGDQLLLFTQSGVHTHALP